MEIQDILSLVQAVSDHGLTEFQLDDGKVKLSFKKEEPTGNFGAGRGTQVQHLAGAAGGQDALIQNVVGADGGRGVQIQSLNGTGGGEAACGSGNIVTSPLVGTFYSAPSPDAESYVKVGDTVKKGQVLGIIEAMKLMNEIESDYDGVVEAILVNNEDVVEYGQPLFRIR